MVYVASGEWREASGKCRTDVHPLAKRHASATQIIGKLCGRRAVFPGFSTTAAMSAKLVTRATRGTEVEQAAGRELMQLSLHYSVAQALPLLS